MRTILAAIVFAACLVLACSKQEGPQLPSNNGPARAAAKPAPSGDASGCC